MPTDNRCLLDIIICILYRHTLYIYMYNKLLDDVVVLVHVGHVN